MPQGAIQTALSYSPAAERMRRFRQRRRDDTDVIMLEICKTGKNNLIQLGYLQQAHRGDKYELTQALYEFLSDAYLAVWKIKNGVVK